MTVQPLVSVIIPAYNAESLIGETVDSVLNQSYGNVEIIVVDDGSTDATESVVKGYGQKVRYFYQDNSGGCAVPRNTGIAQSLGEFLCFLDADDLITPDRVAVQVDLLVRNPDLDLVISDYANFNEDGPYPGSHFTTCPQLSVLLNGRREAVIQNARRYLASENFGSSGSFMMRRRLLTLEGGFEPTLKSCEDFHFYFRLARHTPVGIVDEVVLKRRMHGTNMSGNRARMLNEGLRSRSMLIADEVDAETRKLLNQYCATCLYGLAWIYMDQGQYREAFSNCSRAFFGHFSWSNFWLAQKCFLRTLLLAVGVAPAKIRDRLGV